MKLKKYRIFLFFLFSLELFSNNIEKLDEDIKYKTILEEAEDYFSNIDWVESANIFNHAMAEPFMIEEIIPDNLTLYSDTDLQDSLYPYLEGLGILDYTGIERSVLNFLNTLSLQLKESRIDPVLCSKEKPFLPHLINYRLDSLKPIISVFYSRPEHQEDKKQKALFRCNIRGEEKEFYRIFEIVFFYMDEKWYVDSFDVIGDEYEQSSQ